MPTIWMMSDDVRSQMAIACIDAQLHAELALKALEARPAAALAKADGYLRHIQGLLTALNDTLHFELTDRQQGSGLACFGYGRCIG